MKPWGACRVIRAGLVDFDAAWEFQRELADAVRSGAPPVLLLLEHPPVFTLGRNADAANLLAPGEIPVKRIDRGGDVTYHGPGQLVAYPILNLRERRLGVRDHVRALERAIAAVLKEYGIAPSLRDDCVGVWTRRGKIASLGVRVAGGVSLHGAALNVNADLAPFARINPCGVPRGAVTSISEETGRRVEVGEVADRLVPKFAEAFRFESWKAEPARVACGPA
ncbi:MAG TPA: lipoyl(octanoyl) transferase LipB [Planctomycetota bacterium]|jgi:lipoyl(octanoyl) transferase